MNGIKYLITVAQRAHKEEYLTFFRKHGVNRILHKLCQGTASKSTLSYLGLEDTGKVMFECVIIQEDVNAILRDLYLEMDIGQAGKGVAIVVPLDCVGGKSSLEYLVGNKEINKEKESDMGETNNVLIVTIVDKGNTDLVMDAARGAGAGGGTVAKANGTGAEIAKFFGVSISEEKEMVYIVSPRSDRDAIMHAIMSNAGSKTKAHGVVFALPVEKVVGIKRFEQF